MEKNVRLGCVVATILWAVAALLTLIGSLAALEDRMGVALVLLSHAILTMAAGSTLTVRNLFERQNRLITHAYRIGREGISVARIGGV